jgi:hypothetical protein
MEKEATLEDLLKVVSTLGYLNLRIETPELKAHGETLTIAINKIKEIIK